MAESSCVYRSKIYFVVSTYFCTWGFLLLLLTLFPFYADLEHHITDQFLFPILLLSKWFSNVFFLFLCLPLYRLLVSRHLNLFLVTFIPMFIAVSFFSYILFTWPNYFSRFPSNSKNKFWIPGSSIKISFPIVSILANHTIFLEMNAYA